MYYSFTNHHTTHYQGLGFWGLNDQQADVWGMPRHFRIGCPTRRPRKKIASRKRAVLGEVGLVTGVSMDGEKANRSDLVAIRGPENPQHPQG